jgi:hypothetical protein
MTAEIKATEPLVSESSKGGGDQSGVEQSVDGLNTIKRGLQSVASDAIKGAKQSLSDSAEDAIKVAHNAQTALSEQTQARPLVLLVLTFLAGFAFAEATHRRRDVPAGRR